MTTLVQSGAHNLLAGEERSQRQSTIESWTELLNHLIKLVPTEQEHVCETLSTIPSAQTLIAPADADQLTCTRLPKKLLDKDRFETT